MSRCPHDEWQDQSDETNTALDVDCELTPPDPDTGDTTTTTTTTTTSTATTTTMMLLKYLFNYIINIAIKSECYQLTIFESTLKRPEKKSE